MQEASPREEAPKYCSVMVRNVGKDNTFPMCSCPFIKGLFLFAKIVVEMAQFKNYSSFNEQRYV